MPRTRTRKRHRVAPKAEAEVEAEAEAKEDMSAPMERVTERSRDGAALRALGKPWVWSDAHDERALFVAGVWRGGTTQPGRKREAVIAWSRGGTTRPAFCIVAGVPRFFAPPTHAGRRRAGREPHDDPALLATATALQALDDADVRGIDVVWQNSTRLAAATTARGAHAGGDGTRRHDNSMDSWRDAGWTTSRGHLMEGHEALEALWSRLRRGGRDGHGIRLRAATTARVAALAAAAATL